MSGYSFNAYSAVYRVTGGNTKLGCGSIGNKVDFDAAAKCFVGKQYEVNGYISTYTSIRRVYSNPFGAYVEMFWSRTDGRTGDGTALQGSIAIETCDEPEFINPDTGVCEEPPPPTFCESPEIQEKREAEMEMCTAIGGNYVETCTNEPEKWSPDCINIPPKPPCDQNSPHWPECLVPEPDKCEEGSANWPECNDIAPCTPDYPQVWPKCLFPDPENPEYPDFDSDRPPSETKPPNPLDPKPELPPVADNNGDVLIAITNLNKNNNDLITRLNTDLNSGLTTNNETLEVINKNTIAFWQDSIDGFNNLNQSINNQNGVLTGIGNTTNNLLGNLTNSNREGFGSVVDKLGDISDNLNAEKDVEIRVAETDSLYSSAQKDELNNDVTQLKKQYNSILNDFRHYFNFQTEVKAGDYNSHTLKQKWAGQELTFDNFALTVFVDNADIIGLVIIFGFGIIGVRVILEAM